MKRKWKSGNQLAIDNEQLARRSKKADNWLLLIAYCLLLISLISCNKKDEHRHIPTSKSSELDGLVQPANQTVFSEIKTVSPSRHSIAPVVKATGVISYDPRMFNNISARFSGRIEKLYVRFNFESVIEGQRIMDIYSPEILTAQQDLLFTLINSANDNELIHSSEQKLRLLGLTEAQVKQILTSKKVINPVPIYSPYSGHIHDIGASSGVFSTASPDNNMGSGMNGSSTPSSPLQIENLPSSQTSALTIKEGMYVQSGQVIFSVYNTSRVWAALNIFPQDATWIKVGDRVAISTETNPNHVISATISYIEPVAGQNASSIKARVYLENPETLHLRVGTFIMADIQATEIKGIWLPRNAVVNLGQKQIVFKKSDNHFIAKAVQTGIISDSLVQIISGLNGDESVAANAQYMVDSESFIQTEAK